MNFSAHSHQRGSTLLVALVVLLIVTMLAISNMREATLESRMTGNLVEQKRLQNAADSGQREAERRFINTIFPPEPTSNCTKAQIKYPCVLDIKALGVTLNNMHKDPKGTLKSIYDAESPTATSTVWMPYRGTDLTTPTLSDRNIGWNSIPAPSGGTDNEEENVEYGALAAGTNIFYYEANASASGSSVIKNEANQQSLYARFYTQ